MSKDVREALIPELWVVRLKIKKGDWPAGTVGTVVHIYGEGVAYEVEVHRPGETAVLTVEAGDIVPLPVASQSGAVP